jgi:hypothetical protein
VGNYLAAKIGRGTPTTARFPEVHDKIDLFHLGAQGIFQKAGPLYASGRSLRDISKELGISKTTLRKTLIEGGVDLRPSNRSLRDLPARTTRPHVGVAPYGYCVIHGKLVEVPKEQQTVHLILRLRSEGKSLTAIATHLNARKVKPRTAKKWDHSIVRSIIQRDQRSRKGDLHA